MLTWTAGALAAAGTARGQVPQITPDQQRIMDCGPRFAPGEPGVYTDAHLVCLQAELQRHVPVSFEAVPGPEALEIVESRRGDGKVHLIAGTTEDVFRLFEGFTYGTAPIDDILATAAKIDGGAWLDHQFRTATVYAVDGMGPGAFLYGTPDGGSMPDASQWREVPLSEVEVGEWPDAVESNDRLWSLLDFSTGAIRPQVTIVSFTDPDWTKAPAFMRYGGWNACPPPEAHVAVLRHWRERYGAELVCAAADTLELRVARRPADRNAALKLAQEQYAYCMDIVDQGAGTLANLAGTLMESPYWYFWWD